MNLVEMKCPNCGAQLKLAPKADHVICEYCDSRILIERADRVSRLASAEEEGYLYEKGRQRALREAQAKNSQSTQSAQSAQSVQTGQGHRRHTLLWVLGWLIIFPLPATILIARSNKLASAIKAVLIVLVWLVYIAITRTS